MPTPSVSCFVYSRFPNQISARISCSVLPTRDFSSRWEIITRHVKGHSDYSPSINAHNWTVSDHQWSKALKLRIGFTLRMRNCVSLSRFERLRISDRKEIRYSYCRNDPVKYEQLLVSMKPSEIDMKNDISRPSVGVLVFSFQLAITPPL